MRSTNLDFEAFAVNAIQQVDQIRSLGLDSTSTIVESRINAFYRLLGLPSAIRYSEIKNDDNEDPITDGLNTGNGFKGSVLGITRSNQYIFANRARGFMQPVTQKEAQSFLNFNKSALSSGTKGFNEQGARRRGILFPMIVNGELPIFPQERRVASPFSSKREAEVDGIQYKRPFLETIIALRLKGDGVYSSELQQQINESFPDVDTSNLHLIQAQLLLSLKRAINSAVEELASVSAEINRVSKQLSAYSVPTAGLVAETLVPFSDMSPGVGTVEQRANRLSAEESLRAAMLTIFEYDDSFLGSAARNLRDNGLTSSLLSAVSSQASTDGRNTVQNQEVKNKNETEREREKAKQNARKVFRKLELLLGTFGGLSGVDVLVIMTAMVQLDINDLLGLLNEESKNSLNKIKARDDKVKGKPITANATPVREAIQALEKKVEEIYKGIDQKVKPKKHREKGTKKQTDSS